MSIKYKPVHSCTTEDEETIFFLQKGIKEKQKKDTHLLLETVAAKEDHKDKPPSIVLSS